MKRLTLLAACASLLSLVIACEPETKPGENEKPADVSLSVNPTTLILDADQTSCSFKLNASEAWSIDSDAEWITAITPSNGEAGTDLAINVTVVANDGNLRSGKITVTCGSKTATVTVSQATAANKAVFGQVYLMKASLIEDARGFNMLSDPSFEDHATQAIDYKSPWWILGSDRVTDPHTGDYAARLKGSITENLGFQTVCAKPYTDYEVSAWFKSNKDAENPDTYLGMRIGIGDRPVLKDENKGGSFSTSWSQSTTAFNTGNNPIVEAFAFSFAKDEYVIQWDDVVLKRPGDEQKSYMLTSVEKLGSLSAAMNGTITSFDGCTAWDGGDGKTMVAFGQNVGDAEFATKANALAYTTDTNIADGLDFEVVSNDGKVQEILPLAAGEKGIVPTAGVNAGGKQWIHFQSINTKEFGSDMWTIKSSGLAYSEDGGKTWTRSNVNWGAESNFAQVAFLRDNGYVYMYGSTAGRIVEGEQYMKLARVAENEMGNASSWTYWNGSSWVADESAAVAIIYVGTLGEISVIKNANGRYLMMYSTIKRDAIVVRDAASPEGDWSGEKIVLVDDEDEVLYAPTMLPVSAIGNDIYFLMSSAWGE